MPSDNTAGLPVLPAAVNLVTAIARFAARFAAKAP
jgi:hypothetical protein